MQKYSIVITAGDPAGIGYEEACKFFLDEESKKFNAALIGHKWIVEKTYKDILKKDIPNHLEVLEPDNNVFDYEYGKISAECGKAAISYIDFAVKGALEGMFDAVVTCPINKKSIKEAGYNFPGHTEYLAYLSNIDNQSMMLAGKYVKTILATTHYPVKEIAKHINEKTVLTAIENAHKAGRYFGSLTPKIAVCGLNPHAGDNGALGCEEQEIISPAVKKAQNNGINAHGPFPADTIFTKAKEWDFIIAMYHDQGMIPVKMDAFGEAVNITLNLPFIRTSVDHGTAFDIAGKGVCSYSSLIKAVQMAKNMVEYDKSIRSI
ncbi:MAG: 4-hydroxythreonine-4-phosphate dehydrogenase PdxA [Mucispirillum sp.]|nr:4-hydroxythreonine-4-phosphate dehydrogenase PdxA [Mucispirillum sp.]